MNSVYAVFKGAYSDWSVIGYYETEELAQKYCALQNQKNVDNDMFDNYYCAELSILTNDVQNVKLKYEHGVVFDFNLDNETKTIINQKMRNEPDRYKYYTGKEKPEKISANIKWNNNWICFKITAKSREIAEKIAQDKFAEFLYYYSEDGDLEESAKLIGCTKFM